MKVIEKIWSELKIEKEIGRGAYGNVYRCVDTKTDEYSAVKVISVPSAENGLVEYGTDKLSHEETQAYYKEIADDLVKEIEILKSLKGTDNIVEIYDARIAEKEHGVGWYILIKMELLTEFKTYSAKKDFTEADVLKLGTDLCSALSVCHKAKILHRDIKPENIFVDSEGNYKLGDFGVAKQMEKTQGSMSIKGTFNYMSPEVFGGKKCDSRADLYSLAIVMYKLLNNNRMPFIDKDKETVRYSERQSAFEKRMRGDNIPPIPGVNSELNRVILKACAYNPVDRYRSAEEFASQIQQIINGQKIKKSVKKSLVKKIVAAVTVVSVLLVAGAFTWYDMTKIEKDAGASNYKEPEFVAVEKGEISSKSIGGKYLYYGEDGVYILSNDEYIKVTDTQPINACFDGKDVYYTSFEKNNDLYKNTIHIYSLENKDTTSINIDDKCALSYVLCCEDEKIYFSAENTSADSRYLYFYDPDQPANKINFSDNSMEHIYNIFDGLVIYSQYSELIALELSDVTANNHADDEGTVISELFSKDAMTFYKDGKFYFVEEVGKGKIAFFCSYDLKTKPEDHDKLADVNALGVSPDAEILTMNDKYALVRDNGELRLIIYGDGKNNAADIKKVSQIHLDKYVGEKYDAFVDPEISDRIVLSVQKENAVYFYSIMENGKLAFAGKTDTVSALARINNALVYEIDEKSKNFKKYEIGG